MSAATPVRLCVVKHPDGDDTSVIVVGWHRTDGPAYAHGQDDGQDHLRRQAALTEAALPANVPFIVTFMDLDLAPQRFDVPYVERVT